MQTIIAEARNEAMELTAKEGPFIAKKLTGRIMAGIESVQQLLPTQKQHGSQNSRTFQAAVSSHGQTFDAAKETSFLPKEL